MFTRGSLADLASSSLNHSISVFKDQCSKASIFCFLTFADDCYTPSVPFYFVFLS